MRFINKIFSFILDEPKEKYIYCRRCGRKLKSEQSKVLGMGSCCYKKEVEHKYKKLF